MFSGNTESSTFEVSPWSRLVVPGKAFRAWVEDKNTIFNESASRLIQSISGDIGVMYVYCIMYNVPSVGDWNQESWRLLVEQRIANIGKLRNIYI